MVGRLKSALGRWLPQARLPGMFLLALLLCLAVYWSMLHASHERMREQVRGDIQRLAGQTASAMAQQVSAVVRTLDYFSRNLSWQWLHGAPASFHDASLSAIRTLTPDALTQIAVADAQGDMLYSSLSWGGPESGAQPAVSIADREHFKVHAQAKASFLFVSAPIKGRISQQWTIQFSRGLWADGQFMGVLVMSVSVEHLAGTLQAIAPDPSDAATLVKTDGTYLARSYFLADVLGRKLPSDRPFITHPEQAQGAYQTVGQADYLERFYSWHRVEGYPLVAVVGLGSEDAMALINESISDSHWQSGAGSALLLVTALTLGILWTQRSVRSAELQSAVDALAVETSRLSAVLACVPGGMLIKDAADKVVFVNALWPQLLGLNESAPSLRGMSDVELRALLGPVRAAWLPHSRSEAVADNKLIHEVSTMEGRYLEINHIEVLEDQRYFGAIWLVRDITDRKQRELQLTELASTDTLTGLLNRRSFMDGINALYEAVKRDDTVSGVVMMLDIDRFKRVNDTYGHASGDVVLQYVAKLIKDSIRATDIPARYGGEEFVLLLPRVGIQEGMLTAERIRQAMESSSIHVEGHDIRVTISIGVSLLGVGHPPETALQQADLALYHAKRSGRNRICLWEKALQPE